MHCLSRVGSKTAARPERIAHELTVIGQVSAPEAFPVTRGVKTAIAYKDERLHDDGNVDIHTREIGAWGEVKW